MIFVLQSKQGTKSILGTIILLIYLFSNITTVQSSCRNGCDLALASFFVWRESDLPIISKLFGNILINDILDWNTNITNTFSILAESRINIPFRCDCLNNGEFLGHVFPYNVSYNDTYDLIAMRYYSNLTNKEWLTRVTSYPEGNIPDYNVTLNVTVNCSCGNKDVSKDYGLFITYPMRPGENLGFIGLVTNTRSRLIEKYNPRVNFSAGSGLLYIPGRDKLGNYPPIPIRYCSSGKVIAAIAVAALAGVSLLVGIIYVGIYRKKEQKVESHIPASSEQPHPPGPAILGIHVDKSVEFSYKELAESTNDFSISNKIGEGGFGTVYYVELRGKVCTVKRMNRQGRKEFLAELKILTRAHHLNLVSLIGYCVERSIFLVYEFIENGNLNQHLRGKDALPWSTRVQIALDSARGLEYIHEHTVPFYIHRDIKSANILIHKNFHAKVSLRPLLFGLAKLVESGNPTLPSRLLGTFGYMPPEYGHSGIISPKVDVYAFGVVLHELISSKEAIVKEVGTDEPRSLVALFDEAHNHPNQINVISRLIDPKLGDNYPLDSVYKMAQLAKACPEKGPQMRTAMKSVVVTLMALSSSTED
ncbi:lysM domain receptor-like kinase 3 [Lycium ferocissimum]|uniref:lysM domain receptor-like kinase 3 n=1 Tax=Lycium ferocissimum TaxID=112874 RepID=UPI0028167BA7|nr:lysM domain receptor-like kinase 3 [Lycium ferocissimum]